MALHGWEPVAERLSVLAAQQHWGEMPGLIDDEMLHTFALVCPAAELAQRLYARYRGLADRLSLYLPFMPGERDDFWRRLVDAKG